MKKAFDDFERKTEPEEFTGVPVQCIGMLLGVVYVCVIEIERVGVCVREIERERERERKCL